MILSKKVRLYPSEIQEQKLLKSVGTARFIYNWTIERQEENYKNGGKFISDGILRKEITQLKKNELSWLRVVIEDLKVSNMMKNRHLSNAISKQGFYEFRRQLEYKCDCGLIIDRDLNASINLSKYKLA